MEREGTEGEEDEGRGEGEEGKGEEEREQEEGGGEKAETERGEKGEDEDEEEEMGDERRGGGGCFSTVPGSGCFPQRPKYKPPGAPGCPWLMGRGPRLSSKSPRSSCSILTNVHHYASPTSSITLKTPPLTARQATVHPLCADSCSGGPRLIPLQEAPINCALIQQADSHNSDRSHFFPAQSLPEQSSSVLNCFRTFVIWTK